MIVFTSLLEEIADLVEEAKTEFYPALVLYGEGEVRAASIFVIATCPAPHQQRFGGGKIAPRSCCVPAAVAAGTRSNEREA